MRYDHAQLGALSKRLADAIFAVRPELREYASMERGAEADGLSVHIAAASPTDDGARLVEVWVDEKVTPSVGFGPDHTHGSPDDPGIAEVLDILLGVISDQIVIIEDVGGDHPGFSRWLDMRVTDALEEAVTDRYSPGRAILKSWSGKADRYVGL